MSAVYFIRAVGGGGPVKIGHSYAARQRLHHYTQWSPVPLEIVAEIEGDQRLEYRFHTMFEHLHSHHEWFRPAPELDAVIEQVRAGTFDIATLPTKKDGIRKRLKGINISAGPSA